MDLGQLKPGVAVIFNFIDFDGGVHKDKKLAKRVGSVHDVERLKNVFHLMDLSVVVVSNLYLQEFKAKVEELRNYDFSEYASINLVYMSHGGENNVLYCNDGQFDFVEESEKILRNSTLQGKPRYIIVQACKGTFDINQNYDGPSSKYHGGEITSILTCSFEGFVGYLSDTGSSFIKTLGNFLKEYWYKEPYGDILTRVQNEFESDQQSPNHICFNLNDKFSFANYYKENMPIEKEFAA